MVYIFEFLKKIDLKYAYRCRKYSVYFSKNIMFTSSCAISSYFTGNFVLGYYRDFIEFFRKLGK